MEYSLPWAPAAAVVAISYSVATLGILEAKKCDGRESLNFGQS